MSAAGPPRFLARRHYRRRRIIDAARLLPVTGFFIFFLPILWHPADTAEPDTARGGLYLFAGWFALISAAFLIARALSRDDIAAPEDGLAEPGETAAAAGSAGTTGSAGSPGTPGAGPR